jgi:hypothetical protein
MNTPIPPYLAADMAAAARRDTQAAREQLKSAFVFALFALAAAGVVYLIW